NQDWDGCKSLFVHARWRPLRRAETKRRNRNGEQEEKSRSEKIVTDKKTYTVTKEEGGQKNSKKTCDCQGVQTGLEEKAQESRWKISEEGRAQGRSNEYIG